MTSLVTTEERVEGEQGEQPITPETVSEVREGGMNRLRKRLQGDLDSILLTALRKEPSRRYSSVESFSEDLRRHLEDRPVSAREDSVWYRVSRFVHRHPVGVAAGALLALSVAAGLLTVLWEMRIALDARQQKLSGRAILAPQLALWVSLAPAALGSAFFFTRARLRRVGGALAGGMLFAATWFFKLRLEYSMGWWRTFRFSRDARPPFAIFPGLDVRASRDLRRAGTSGFLAGDPPVRLGGTGRLYRRRGGIHHQGQNLVGHIHAHDDD